MKTSSQAVETCCGGGFHPEPSARAARFCPAPWLVVVGCRMEPRAGAGAGQAEAGGGGRRCSLAGSQGQQGLCLPAPRAWGGAGRAAGPLARAGWRRRLRGGGAGAAQPVELLTEGVRNPQLLAPRSWRVWLEKQQQRGVSMGTYTGLRAPLHPKIHPGPGTVVPLPTRAARLLAALQSRAEPGASQARGEGARGSPLALPPLCQPWDGALPAEPRSHGIPDGITYRTTGPSSVCLPGAEGHHWGMSWEQGSRGLQGCAAPFLLQRRERPPCPSP